MRLFSGLPGYTVIWLGQLVGVLGSSITRFAIPLWVWQETHSATAMAYMSVFSLLPLIFISPLTGALVDRWSQHLRRVMMISDVGNVLMGLGLLTLWGTGQFKLIWVYLLLMLQAVFESFQWPAYSTAATVMLPKEHYARASAMQGTAMSAASITAPLLGALLFAQFGLARIVQLEIACALLALLALLLVHVPASAHRKGESPQGHLWREALYGFQFIASHRSLLSIQLVFLTGNWLYSLAGSLHAPMILARSGSDVQVLAAVEMAAGVGSLVAGLAMSAWGGPKRLVYGVLGGWCVSMVGLVLMGLGQAPTLWLLAAVVSALAVPLTNSSNQAIWQRKTPPGIQGKVFAARRVIAWAANPLAALVAGPLADRVIGPAMQPNGALSRTLGPLFGVGSGAGMALIIAVVGALGLLIMLSLFSVRPVREIEALVPDFDERG